jgi:Mor family transcriptional regulator
MVHDPARDAQIVALWRAGQSNQAIARQTHWSAATVTRVLARHGLVRGPQRGPRRHLAQRNAGIRHAYERGAWPRDLARQWGLSRRTIQRIVQGKRLRKRRHDCDVSTSGL